MACAVFPIALILHRVSGEALAEALSGLGLECDVDVQALWAASDVVDEHIGDEPVTPLAPRIAARAAQHDLPASLVTALDSNLRAQGAGDRLDETIEELIRIRAEVGWPPLASPIGQVLGSQALLNVLSSSRYSVVVDELRSLVAGHLGTTPAPIDKSIQRAIGLTADPDSVENTRLLLCRKCGRSRKGSRRARRSSFCSVSSATMRNHFFGRSAGDPAATRRSRPVASTRLAQSASASSCASCRRRASAR
jgi:pyruvate/oxaloacetate carboxyltransferase